MAKRGPVIFAALIGLGTYALQPTVEKREEKKLQGLHCLSLFDGAHRELVDAVRARLRDPDSFEHISTFVTRVSVDGTHSATMRYRARNGLGGMDVEAARGMYSHADCKLLYLF